MKTNKQILIAALLSTAIFMGCNTPKQVARHYDQFKDNHREKFAEDCSLTFPPQETFVTGEAVVTHDTVTVPGERIPCPPDANGIVTMIDCPPARTIHDVVTRIDTVKVVDGAAAEFHRLKSERLQGVADSCIAEMKSAQKEAKESKETASTRLWIIIAFGIVFVGAIIIKIKNRI